MACQQSDTADMLEELDSEFQKSLKVAAGERRAGKARSFRECLKEPPTARRAGREGGEKSTLEYTTQE
ncbi:MAG: hypothetical protein ACE5JD_15310 [Candidatus Methylomirabilia bacterium]